MTFGNCLTNFVFLALLSLPWVIAGKALAGIALSLGLYLSVYFGGGRLLLRFYRARFLPAQEAPEIYALLQELCSSAGMCLPKIYLVSSRAANAFAVSLPPYAGIVISQGLLAELGPEEFQAVLAHELAHIRRGDTVVALQAAMIAAVLNFLASTARALLGFGAGHARDSEKSAGKEPVGMLIAAVLRGFSVSFVRLMVSARCEYAADRWSANLCAQPLYLASALRKLDAASVQKPFQPALEAAAHVLIINPVCFQGWRRFFSAHPPVEERIVRLEAQAREMGF